LSLPSDDHTRIILDFSFDSDFSWACQYFDWKFSFLPGAGNYPEDKSRKKSILLKIK
jgi:hypothetical protein